MSSPNIIEIIDRGDPRIAPFISVRERDLTGGSGGRFIVEGKIPLTILLRRSRFAVDSLFLCETRLEPLKSLLESVPPGIPIYVSPQKVMDSVAGFPVHRGILACARKTAAEPLTEMLTRLPARPQTLLVLNQISNHDNVGAAFRNAAAFGADAVILDNQSCDPLYRKAIRVSSGTALWLPYYQEGTGAAHIAMLKEAGFTVWAMTPNTDAEPLQSQKIPEKIAILLGAEGPGLESALLEAANPVRIPMVAGIDSVNVATAGAITLAHIFAARPGGLAS